VSGYKVNNSGCANAEYVKMLVQILNMRYLQIIVVISLKQSLLKVEISFHDTDTDMTLNDNFSHLNSS
jgi:hypothetical protein